jgi:hypothetical protein
MEHLSSFVVPAYIIAVLAMPFARILIRGHSRMASAAEWLFDRRVSNLTALALALAFAFAVSSLSALGRREIAAVEIDMLVDRGDIAEVFVNRLDVPPVQVPLDRGVRRVYRFEMTPQPIAMLRIDPSNAAGSNIALYRIRVLDRGNTAIEFPPEALKPWTSANTTVELRDGALVLQSTTIDPMLYGSVSVPMVRAGLLAIIGQRLTAQGWFAVALTVCALLFLLGGAWSREGSAAGATVAFIIVAASPVARAVYLLAWPPPAVEVAVGAASYTGYPKFRDHLASLAVMAIAVGAGWLLNRVAPARTPAEQVIHAKPGRYAVAAHLLVLVALAAIFQPSLPSVLSDMETAQFRQLDWDSQNNFYWQYMVHEGRLPFRDFWYPYGGFYLQYVSFPWNSLVMAAQSALTFWFLYLGLFGVLGRRVLPALAVFAVIFLPGCSGELHSWFRYLLAINIVLAYAAIQPDARRPREYLLFAATTGFACFWEAAQVIYAGFGIAVHITLSAYSPGGTLKTAARQLWRRMWPVAVAGAAGSAPVLAYFAARGMLGGFVRFYFALGETTVYSGTAADVAAWLRPSISPGYVLILTFAAAGLASYVWFSHGMREHRILAALVALSFTGLLVLQKFITRPFGVQQFLAYPFIAIVLYAAMVWRHRNLPQVVIAGLLAGTIVGAYWHSGFIRLLTLHISALIPRAYANASLIASSGERIKRANAEAFGASRFAAFTSEREVMAALRAYTPPAGQKLFVLGDAPIFYMLARQEAPYIVNGYNASPKSEQDRILNWLKDVDPGFVVWNPEVSAFDSVPHAVRLPLIYRYVAERYSLWKIVAGYHILRRHGATAAPSDYWRQHLGEAIDLGYIPAACREDEYSECDPGARNDCVTVLAIALPTAPAVDREAAIRLKSANASYTVRFRITGHERDYFINLDRLWFAPSTTAATVSIDHVEQGMHATLKPMRVDAEVLY